MGNYLFSFNITDAKFFCNIRSLLLIAENKVDSDYYEFIANVEGFKYLKNSPVWPKTKLDDDIKQALYESKAMGCGLKNGFDIRAELPPGNYACLDEVFFAPVRLPSLNVLPSQGWKIHITAHPHSAQKIAALILSQIDAHIELAGNDGKGTPAQHTFYKYGNLKGERKETQAGKSITIYPSNRKHAAALAQTLDNILLWAIKGGILTKNDFYPCVGDALVGESGGIYVRYGYLTRREDRVQPTKYSKTFSVLPNSMLRHSLDSCISFAANVKAIKDDRRYPWPDFMNKNDLSWKDAKNPFPGLNLRWYFNSEMPPITWENRPDFWLDLQARSGNTKAASAPSV
ncbi:hypothetical protein BN59_02578 [Legionella massiliensis]|uniref:RamC N-terminal domain-containing protein n=1 Tax=Legionella massiliensis TaxID=1034943 RepID=A0A078L2M3_9GAMM|nr:hypothetical protein [Legionella massiliensis]CDZ78268.1 hypothetical protein BN59_02578 [Legionella massiliensis]CEE14006.1 hypothetical protein BN1094_02578 [Legionella massiliensis]